MKKLLVYIVCVLVIGISSFFIFNHMQAAAYEETAVPYIKQVLPRISTWDVERVSDYMASEVIDRIPHDQLVSLMEGLSRLGSLESIDNVKFKNKASGQLATTGEQPVVTYDIDATYSSGPVGVTISLLDQGGTFVVYHFNFYSRVLAGE